MPRRRPFRYEALLRVRQHEEDFKAQALAAVRRDIGAAKRQRAEIELQQRTMLEQAGRLAREKLDAAAVHGYYQYERHLARLAVEKDAELAELRGLEDTRRGELEDAMRRRRIVERLKERQNKTFWEEVDKEQRKFADEVATNRAAMMRQAHS